MLVFYPSCVLPSWLPKSKAILRRASFFRLASSILTCRLDRALDSSTSEIIPVDNAVHHVRVAEAKDMKVELKSGVDLVRDTHARRKVNSNPLQPPIPISHTVSV